MTTSPIRRRILAVSAGLPFAAALPARAQNAQDPIRSSNEDLMEEHGLVGRVFGIYRATMAHLAAGREFDHTLVAQAAQLVDRVIHKHHEQEEEKVLFPRVQNASTEMKSLITVLIGQHQAARGLTASIIRNLSGPQPRDEASREALSSAMSKFIAMYEPHGAYENTIVYPAFRKSMSPNEYTDLAQRFAETDRRVNGKGGHEANVAQVNRIEMLLGIGVAEFTRQKDRPS